MGLMDRPDNPVVLIDMVGVFPIYMRLVMFVEMIDMFTTVIVLL